MKIGDKVMLKKEQQENYPKALHTSIATVQCINNNHVNLIWNEAKLNKIEYYVLPLNAITSVK